MKLPSITINTTLLKTYLPFGLLAVAILVELLLLAFYFPGKIFSLLDMRDQITSLASEVKQLSLATDQLAAVDQNTLSSQLRLAEVALPDEKKVAGLIAGLGRVASSSGVVVKNIGFSPGVVSTGSAVVSPGTTEVEIGDRVRAIPVTLTVTASLPQFLDYLKKIQAASQLLGVTEINYNLLASETGGDVGLIVYYLPARTGKPSWQFIPSISADDLAVLSKLSPADIFSLPGASR